MKHFSASVLFQTILHHIIFFQIEIRDILPLDLKGKFVEHTVPMMDAKDQNLIGPVQEATAYIHKVHQENPKNHILLHCTQGISRSASTAIAYMMEYHGHSLRSAYDYVKDRRAIIDPRPNFIEQLQTLEKMLYPETKEPTLTVEELFGHRKLLNIDADSKNDDKFMAGKECSSKAAQSEIKSHGTGGVKMIAALRQNAGGTSAEASVEASVEASPETTKAEASQAATTCNGQVPGLGTQSKGSKKGGGKNPSAQPSAAKTSAKPEKDAGQKGGGKKPSAPPSGSSRSEPDAAQKTGGNAKAKPKPRMNLLVKFEPAKRLTCSNCGQDYAARLGDCPSCFPEKRSLRQEKKDPLEGWRTVPCFTADDVLSPEGIPFEEMRESISIGGGSGGIYLYKSGSGAADEKLAAGKWFKEPLDAFACVLNRSINDDTKDIVRETGKSSETQESRYLENSKIRFAAMRLLRRAMRPKELVAIMTSLVEVRRKAEQERSEEQQDGQREHILVMENFYVSRDDTIEADVEKFFQNCIYMGNNFFGVLEVISGLQTFPGPNGLISVPPRYHQRILFELGKVTAFDSIINNSDRVPLNLLWFNEGNLENLMIEKLSGTAAAASSCDSVAEAEEKSPAGFAAADLNDNFRVVGIDSTFNPIVPGNGKLIYQARLEIVCDMIRNRTYEEIAKQSTANSEFRCTGINIPKEEMTTEEAKIHAEGNRVDWIKNLTEVIYMNTGIQYKDLESFVLGLRCGYTRIAKRVGEELASGNLKESDGQKRDAQTKAIAAYLDGLLEDIRKLGITMEEDCLVVNEDIGAIKPYMANFVAENLYIVWQQFPI